MNDFEAMFCSKTKCGNGDGGQSRPGERETVHESAVAGLMWLCQRIKEELKRGTGVASTSLICGLIVPRESESGAWAGS